MALAAACPPAADARQASLEYPVKAAFLYKFASYVDWPAGAFPDAAAPLVVCVIGRDPFGPLLDRTVRGQTVGVRRIVVRRLAAAGRDSPCHIAYLGGSSSQSVAEAARALAEVPVLTVADGPPFEASVVISFVVQANRVRFGVDPRAAEEKGLAISSKLLNLAVSVGP